MEMATARSQDDEQHVMTEAPARARPQYCGFCGKEQGDVEQLVYGAAANICNECVELVSDVVAAKAALIDAPQLKSLEQFKRAAVARAEFEQMKLPRSVGRSRNSRLNLTRKAALELIDLLAAVAGCSHQEVIIDADFWAVGRESVAEMAQCFNEANAYNNVIAGENASFVEDEYALSRAKGAA